MEIGELLAPKPAYPGALFLNDVLGLPSYYRARFATRVDAPDVFLDFTYIDHDLARGALEALDEARRTRGLSFGEQTLILSAVGLDPYDERLLALAGEFAERHVFFELWNERKEVAMLRDAGLAHLYFLPVSAKFAAWHVPGRLARRPNRRIFVSLGGDDDIELVQETIEARRDLTFFVPDHRFRKGARSRETLDVEIRGSNVVRVPCRAADYGFSVGYRAAFAACDTVLIATARDKCAQMRGGIRVADAMRARRRIVMTRNGMCELLMAQHERTCLVAAPDARAIGDALERTVGGAPLDEELYEEIRGLTDARAKLAFMMAARADPEKARRSAFFRDAARIDRDLAALWASFDDGRAVAVPALFDLATGATISVAGAAAKVREIRRTAPAEHEIDLAGARLIELVVSAAPGKRYTTTRHGHALSYRGRELSRGEAAIVDRVAELL